MNRVLIAAPKSGSGKTIFTCGLLNILKEMGKTSAFKCGPDFIDPMFHRNIIGVEGDNLDPFFSSEEEVRRILGGFSGEYAVLEGAMGIYDGISGMGKRGSCYEIAKFTETPIILIVDAKGMGETLISLIKGILCDDDENLISGIILNRISPNYYERLKAELEKNLLGRKLLGFIPQDKRIALESRHLGLKMPEEIIDLKEQVNIFSELIRDNCDLEGIMAVMEEAPEISIAKPIIDRAESGLGLKLAVAKDEAFCFYYRENIKAFTDRGVEIIEFSPLHDKSLPDGIHGLILGGGYPELYAKELSENLSMKESIKKSIEGGLPSMAECGGFMYLLDEMKVEGSNYNMVGVIAGEAENSGRLTRFGYIEIVSEEDGLLPMGERIKGHEFHYFDTNNNGDSCIATKASGATSWSCMHMKKGHLWGYPHLYYPSNPILVDRFLEEMKRVSNNNH